MRFFVVITLMLLGIAGTFSEVQAGGTSFTCTSQYSAAALNATNAGAIKGLFSTIQNTLNTMEGDAEELYKSLKNNTVFQASLAASVIIAVALMGTLITFDVVQLRPGDVMMRVIKLGLVLWLVSPTGWKVMKSTLIAFFMGEQGGHQGLMLGLIEAFWQGTSAGGGGTGSIKDIGEPLMMLSQPAALVFSAKYGIMLMGVMFVGPFGPFFWVALVIVTFNLVLCIYQTMYTYIKCVIGLWFLFAMAPIFFILLLYRTTYRLFEGWLNMVLNFTLQPVLMFAFLSFFMMIITHGLNNLFLVEWCKECLFNHWLLGDWFCVWRPRQIGGIVIPKDSEWTDNGLKSDPNIQFPLDVMDVLFLIMATHLAYQYAKFIPQLTSQLISGGVTLGGSLDEMRQFFQNRGVTPEQLLMKGSQTAGRGAVRGLRGVRNAAQAIGGAVTRGFGG